jgi:DNA-binding MarR family transcriptional regulator
MEDKIWKAVFPDIFGAENRNQRLVIPLVTELCRYKASPSKKQFEEIMADQCKYSVPTIRAYLKRAIDLGYAVVRRDASDGRVRRIWPTPKALRACDLAAKLKVLMWAQLREMIGDAEVLQIEPAVRMFFEEQIIYNAAAAINKEGRRYATN